MTHSSHCVLSLYLCFLTLSASLRIFLTYSLYFPLSTFLSISPVDFPLTNFSSLDILFLVSTVDTSAFQDQQTS